MKNSIITAVIVLCFSIGSYGQNISISNDTTYSAEASAILDLNTTDKGLLIPRVVLNDASTAAPVTAPAVGLLIYNDGGSEPEGFWHWSGSEWLRFSTFDNDGVTAAQLVHGELYLQDPTTIETLALGNAGDYLGLTEAIAGNTTGVNYVYFQDNSIADRLVIGSKGSGKYYVNMSTSFSGSGNNVITCGLFKNGVFQRNLYLKRTLGTTGDVGSASFSGIITLSAGDYIDLRYTSDEDNKDVHIHVANLHISRITP